MQKAETLSRILADASVRSLKAKESFCRRLAGQQGQLWRLLHQMPDYLAEALTTMNNRGQQLLPGYIYAKLSQYQKWLTRHRDRLGSYLDALNGPPAMPVVLALYRQLETDLDVILDRLKVFRATHRLKVVRPAEPAEVSPEVQALKESNARHAEYTEWWRNALAEQDRQQANARRFQRQVLNRQVEAPMEEAKVLCGPIVLYNKVLTAAKPQDVYNRKKKVVARRPRRRDKIRLIATSVNHHVWVRREQPSLAILLDESTQWEPTGSAKAMKRHGYGTRRKGPALMLRDDTKRDPAIKDRIKVPYSLIAAAATISRRPERTTFPHRAYH